MIASINLPNAGPISVEVVGGNNNAASYAIAIWNRNTRRYMPVGQGLAAFNDPTPDLFPLGPPNPLRGMVIVVRAYVLPYAPGMAGFYVGAKLRAGQQVLATLQESPNEPATVNLIAEFT